MIAAQNFGIHTARPDEVGCVAQTLADALVHGDPASWLIPSAETRRAVFPEYFRIFAEFFLRHGQVDATEDLDAVALWWPVGQRLEMEIEDYDARLARVTGDAVGRFVLLDMAMHAHHPTFRPHHYLAFLAVQPARQGQGMGSALLRYRHERLDQDATPAYLEASSLRSRALYERHGYRALQPLVIPAGPTLHPMWRSPGGYGAAATVPRS